MASEPILTVRQLGLVKQGKSLLDAVSFTLQPGRFYGLLGPNGAGKSSLLRLLYRADRPSRGAIGLAGEEIGAMARRRYAARVGALVQEQVNLAGLSLREVVRLGLLPLRLPAEQAEARIAAALHEIGLGHRAEDDAARLSGGEQQRLFFGQLLALDPELYLLDEPHNHLDLHFQYRLLDQVRRRGRTVLASFHDLNLAARYCDEVLLLDHGKLVAQGPVDAVLTRENLAQIYRVDGQFRDGQLTVTGSI
ncbi:ABC transporter ATP-binding protein [Devosia sp. YIM 151766]|uniref:ABC transporter ATP-binding protein n=1 Tax=Devosia sp. YIM 151766 TaxID=3017325 RepID=UPI00255D0CA0|nr:ABC transporter ATP-binding protein [Devosia sp. YIM 151766]WIY52288.1 ABC transporter ATP-binding protein [Devosia sp. YIM 151766]